MTSLEAQQPGIPAPHPGRLSQRYWDGCRDGELWFQRCDTCGTIPARPTSICPHCYGRSLSWERSAGLGSLYSWTVVWRPQHPAFRVPYAPAIIASRKTCAMRRVSSSVAARSAASSPST